MWVIGSYLSSNNVLKGINRFDVLGIQCGYPADVPNGGYQLVNGSIGYLSHVVYTCEEGYEVVGRAQLTCDIDERWNGPPPRCEGSHINLMTPERKQYFHRF